MNNKLVDLRNHLFSALEGLADKEHPMDIERAKAVAEVAKVIVDSAKVEVDFMREFNIEHGTGFLPEGEAVQNKVLGWDKTKRRGDG